MKSRSIIAPVMAVLAAVLVFASCGDQEGGKETAFRLSFDQKTVVTETTVSASTTQAFVYIFSSDSWVLEVHDDVDMGLSMTSSKLGVSAAKKISGKGDSGPIILSFPKNEDDGQREVEFYATCGSVSKTVTITQKSASEDVVIVTPTVVTPINGGAGQTDASGRTTYIDDVSGGRATSAPFSWIELPATDNRDELHFVWHNFSMDGSYHRNYSLYWDYDNLVALWVAYPLTSWHATKNVKRTDAWSLDPFVDDSKEPNLTKGFKEGNNGWFARGHQCPSADRLVCREANAQTFYGTNMTPQEQYSFNSGIWENLEKKVRAWAEKCDTLYVVTGCTVAGSLYYALDNATPQKKVTVPTGYYKAVVAYSKSDSFPGYSKGGYMGCAIYLDHFGSYGSSVTKSMGMSIDALEAKIGLDLFVNLPNAAAVEAENPQNVSWWW